MQKVFVGLLAVLVFASCATPPRPVTTPAPVPAVSGPEAKPPAEPGEFQVSKEKKLASLAEIKLLVDKLNAIIGNKAFSEWKTYLDQDYIRTYSDPVRLKEYSANSPFLRQYSVKLKSLEDFFQFVVVPSRAKVTVDDISFLDENRVNVWTVVDNERVLLYLLKLYGKEWKISSW